MRYILIFQSIKHIWVDFLLTMQITNRFLFDMYTIPAPYTVRTFID